METTRTNEHARPEPPRTTEADASARPERQGTASALRPRLVSSSDILTGIGFGCYTSWVSMAFHSMGLFASDGAGGEQVLDTVYLVSIITITIVLFTRALES